MPRLVLGDGSDGGPLPLGSTGHVQAWYRDPAAQESGANFSPGLAVTRTY